MSRRIVPALLACLALLLGSRCPASAILIDTTGTDNGGIRTFGSPDTATYGQVFTVTGTETHLDSFSLYLRERVEGTGSLDLQGYIAGWNGSMATSLLYTSGIQTMNADGTLQEFSFAPNINLASGQTYVAFLSISDLPAQSDSGFRMPYGGDSIAGGFVFANSGDQFSDLFSDPWVVNFLDNDFHNCANCDVWFTASLSQPIRAELPEPGTLALFSAGLAGFALMAYRRRRA